MKKTFWGLCALALTFACASCEQPVIDEETTAEQSVKNVKNQDDANVVLRVTEFVQLPYTTKAVVDITTYCTRLNFVVYKDGKKVESRSQMKGDENFGETTMKLLPGTYKLLVLAHSSVGGNPSLSDPEKIQFTNSLGYSDTFYYYDNLEVTAEQQNYDIRLTRASSLLRFVSNDELPANVTHFRFYYTGGSGVLNAVTGYGGSVDSRQEKKVNVTGKTPPIECNIYTFLQGDEDVLNVKVEALDKDGNAVLTREFTGIQMKRNVLTEFSGLFFKSDRTMNFTAETEYADTLRLTY